LKSSSAIVSIIFTLFIVQGAIADVSQGRKIAYLESHEIQLQSLSSKVFKMDCIGGDILYGEFVVTSDGDLYQGDQRKYDLWVGWGHGVDFYIFNQKNYEWWLEGESIIPYFERTDVNELSWSIGVNQSGLWYIVYVNDSPSYMKTVEGSIYHSSNVDYFLLGLFLGAVGIMVIILIIWHLKVKNAN
jgi:hypothetical protein